MKRWIVSGLLVAASLGLPTVAGAQKWDPIEAMKQLPALRMPGKAVEGPPDRAEPAMGVYKPAGTGPFPAIVVQHTCAGIQDHVGYWATQLVNAGYAVLVLDSLTERNIRNNCSLPLPIPFINGTLDAYAALEHLAALPFVDKDRIGMLGMSWGASNALLAARKDLADRLPRSAKQLRFGALAALYPHCFLPAFRTPRGPLDIEWLSVEETDRPLLVLMGEADEETPARLCLPRLEALKAKGARVDWQVFPSATHGWDIRSASGYRATTLFGSQHQYQYSVETVQASQKRLLEFFGRELARKN